MGRTAVQGQPEQIDPTSKITRAKWTRGGAQLVQHLLCKSEALSSNQSHSPKKKKEKEKEMLLPAFVPFSAELWLVWDFPKAGPMEH
jgi:hypothetical protein